MGTNGSKGTSHSDRSATGRSLVLALGFAAGVAGGLMAWKQRQQLPPGAGLQRLKPGPTPQTALITGASSGIGTAFARRLAHEGFNLILVARREERLNALAADLHAQYGIHADVFVADLAIPSEVALVERRIAACDTLSILINNAGFGTSGTFAEVDLAKHLDMIHVHVNASVRLAHAALPGMIVRRCGAIINVSSIAAFARATGIATYSASKNYLNTFSEALQIELHGTGVEVQALCPGFTSSEFHDTPEFTEFDRANVPAYLWMSAEAVVQASLNALGTGAVVLIPGFENRMVVRMMHAPLLGPVWRTIRERWRGKPQIVSTR